MNDAKKLHHEVEEENQFEIDNILGIKENTEHFKKPRNPESTN